MVPVAAGPATQHGFCEERFAPKRDESNAVQVFRMEAPQSHDVLGRGRSDLMLEPGVRSVTHHRSSKTLLPIVLCLSIAGGACHRASNPTGYAGTWVMKVGPRVFGVLIIEEKGGTYTGNWTLPEHFGIGMGKLAAFSHVTAQTKRTTFATMTVQGDHLHFVVPDPDAPTEPDEFDMSLVNSNEAVVRFVGVPIEPWPFSRVQDRTVPAVATDWEPQRSYPLKEETFTSNAEMREIFAEDQKVRQGEISEAQWAVISKADAARRERTRGLLAHDQLHTSEDFREAAFVFQHGDESDDYLLAHTLAMVAVGKGDNGAVWIASATLDRYLQSIQRPQIYGTQFVGNSGSPQTQEPFNRDLISDSLRAELGVPSIAQQQEQLKTMNAAPKHQ